MIPSSTNTVFVRRDQETEYRDWMKTHPYGFVLNFPKDGVTASMHVVFHRSGCRVLLRKNSFPNPDWHKLCNNDLGELVSWAESRREFRESPSTHACKMCFRRGAEEFSLLMFRPTADEDLLNNLTRRALAIEYLPKPAGQLIPERTMRESMIFKRDPLVRAFVLQRSRGVCECCGVDAPFLNQFGDPFLEVHHVVPLAEGGPDVVANAVAICPNCHRECHNGQDAEKLTQQLLSTLNGLSPG